MKPNRTLKVVDQINNSSFAEAQKQAALTTAFTSTVKYAATTGIQVEKWDVDTAIVTLKNSPPVQNHIQGIHATAMATLVESTTGMLFGLQVPDTHIPLLKSMKIRYVAIASGDLKAVATLTPEQKARIQNSDKGAMVVPVKVIDSKGKEPIQCEIEWAWIKNRSKL